MSALNGNCNIIPVIDDFQFPPNDSLPDDMKHISHFNGIRFIKFSSSSNHPFVIDLLVQMDT